MLFGQGRDQEMRILLRTVLVPLLPAPLVRVSLSIRTRCVPVSTCPLFVDRLCL